MKTKQWRLEKSFSCKFLSVNFSYTTAYVERILCTVDVLHEIMFEQTSKINAPKRKCSGCKALYKILWYISSFYEYTSVLFWN